MEKDKRKSIGFFGESLACDFLKRKGYKIVDRNSKLSYFEIDIVAEKNNKFYFIEVKTRSTKTGLGSATEALKNKQIKKLKKAITIYSINKKLNLNYIQLDFISIDINKEKGLAKIKHYKDIF